MDNNNKIYNNNGKYKIVKSYKDRLDEDLEGTKNIPNNVSRQVKSGHYIQVKPEPLKNPILIIHSEDLSNEIGFNPNNEIGIKFLSGYPDVIPGFDFSWATPYALTIYGQSVYTNCPFGNGRGYGDGRAISVAEIITQETGKRWELQLKGSGGTPFRRSGDGRSVLRSSLREFLASEAMYSLGVKTTRALSVIVSDTETVSRPWFSPNSCSRKNDIMIQEKTAVLCRVATSFIRVGHFDLFARRIRKEVPNIEKSDIDKDSIKAKNQLMKMVKFTMFREFPESKSILDFLRESSNRIAEMTANWIRVGFCQGNFNSDNCLVSGTQIDYGPFGFIEQYNPLWNMWVDGGKHYSFMNQMIAGHKNFETLVDSIIPILSTKQCETAREIASNHYVVAADTLNDVWRRKMGLNEWTSDCNILILELLDLMEKSKADYTILWRKLIALSYTHDIQDLMISFYIPLKEDIIEEWDIWIKKWISLNPDPEIMKLTNPVYVPREWMLVDAYERANKGDYTMVHELHELFKYPYCDNNENNLQKYFRLDKASQSKPGTAFMTCSS